MSVLTYAQVAQRCNVSTRTVKRWKHLYRPLKTVKVSHRLVRIRESDLDDFLAARTKG